jgi:hypothetical protein
VVGVAEFVQQYAALRWSVVLAFLVASAIVVVRLAAPVGAGGMPRSAGERCGPDRSVAVGESAVSPAEYLGARQNSNASVAVPTAYHESDAAHLIMCLVMLTMLVFPAGANPHALYGVLTAMTVVLGILLIGRIVEWHSENRALPVDRMVALGYHVLAAGAMLYAMSGHGAGGQADGPSPGPALALAALFIADALVAIVAVSAGWRHQWLGHPIGAGSSTSRLSSALVPHMVMDLGTAYMLVAAVSGR